MSKPRQFFILENRCAIPTRCYETESQAFAEMQGNDDMIPVIEFSAYQSAIEELKAAKEVLGWYAKGTPWRDDVGSEAQLACKSIDRIDKFLKENE